jgi:hypothetical protein
MSITQDTSLEIQNLLNGEQYLPAQYGSFLLMWLAFNRAYNDTETDPQEVNRVMNFARRFEHHWPKIVPFAVELVSLECIGGVHVNGSELMKPKVPVKSATHHLRQTLALDQKIDPTNCQFPGCVRAGKRLLCNQVATEPWTMGNMAALFRLVYQVRCSLMHGEKRLAEQNYQTNRDRELVHLCSQIMDPILHWILDDTVLKPFMA